MTLPDIDDWDRYVDRDTAAALLGVTPVYIQELCKKGDIQATRSRVRCRGRDPRVGFWTDIDVLSLIMLSAERHTRSNRSSMYRPEDIIERLRLPLRCPECGALVDVPGPCELCRASAIGLPYYWQREPVTMPDCMAGRLEG